MYISEEERAFFRRVTARVYLLFRPSFINKRPFYRDVKKNQRGDSKKEKEEEK